MKKNVLLTVAVVVLSIGVIVGGFFGYKALSKKGLPDKTLPGIQNTGDYKDFTVTDKNGNSARLSDFIGRPIVINFWASWCPPCKAELPHFDKLAKEYAGKVDFLMVNLSGENKDTVLSFVNKNGYSFPLYFDDFNSGANAYSVSQIPVTVFITAKGNIGARRVGAMSEITLRSYVTQLLSDESR